MQKLASLFLICFSVVAVATPNVSNFIGTWQGNGVYQKDKLVSACEKVGMVFTSAQGHFVFSSGSRSCGSFHEDFQVVDLTVSGDKLLLSGSEVGSFDDNSLQTHFDFPGTDGVIQSYQMKMTREGDFLNYHEELTKVGQSNPLISFSAIMELQESLLKRKALGDSIPQQPVLAGDPGSAVYPYTLFSEKLNFNGRALEFFAPAELMNQASIPLIVFGHGQALGCDPYRASFEHLAKKGAAVLFLEYDQGFFDQDWVRMSKDFVALAELAIRKYSASLDPNKVIFAGHSKGGYIAISAAGVIQEVPHSFQLSSVVVFEPAGYVPELVAQISPDIPVSMTFSHSDTIVAQNLVQEIYDHVPVKQKQMILVQDYNFPDFILPADHFFPLSEKVTFIGGKDGVSAFHYYGTWKWLMGAIWGAEKSDPRGSYLYGNDAMSTGVHGFQHQALRSW